MSRTPRLEVLAVVFAAAAACGAASAPLRSQFEAPLRIDRAPLPRDPDNPQARARVSCFHYPGFIVKEVDLGEIGAEQLSIIPTAAGRPPLRCARANVPGERVIAGGVWSGYFDGAKGGYAVFRAEDGWEDGLGFAVFDAASGVKLLDDAAKGGFQSLVLTPGGLMLRYRRVFLAKCSLRADPIGCWRDIRRQTGLTAASPPDCSAAYDREARRTPKFAVEVRNDPTVIDYEAEAKIAAGRVLIRPRTTAARACRPSE